MKYLLYIVMYVGVGCAYQSTYDDLNVRQLTTADVPISTFGHIFAWPFVVLYHLLANIGWAIVAGLANIGWVIVVGLGIVWVIVVGLGIVCAIVMYLYIRELWMFRRVLRRG